MMTDHIPQRFPLKAAVVCPKCRGTLELWGRPHTSAIAYLKCPQCGHTVDTQRQKPRTPTPPTPIQSILLQAAAKLKGKTAP